MIGGAYFRSNLRIPEQSWSAIRLLPTFSGHVIGNRLAFIVPRRPLFRVTTLKWRPRANSEGFIWVSKGGKWAVYGHYFGTEDEGILPMVLVFQLLLYWPS
ncbi:uncharacterized protein YALI1_D24037g [Yarrowia lipolytica]|uniref:Uncharacterized protein n=1 Tax=Yarrowia lipolytica TaxID=4952 RepID=A0A1D8NF85_YARLL|nr:hypothetical protein YALI1_D24037g [Yarrowia lipolytica]